MSMDFDLDDVEVAEDHIREETARAEGLDSNSQMNSGWFMSETGQQILSFVPFPIREDIDDDESKVMGWDFQTNFYFHKNFISDPDFVVEMKKLQPGWVPMCPDSTLGGHCSACDFKWELGKWYKKHTDDGWKHRDLQEYGVFLRFRGLANVIVHQCAGEWLLTSEGKQWQDSQKRRFSKSDRTLGKFLQGVDEAIKNYEAGMHDTKKSRIMILGKDLHTEIMTVASKGVYHIGHPLKSYPLTITSSYNASNGYRDTRSTTMPHAQPLLLTEDGKADEPAIKELIRGAAVLSKYRKPWGTNVQAKIEERILQLRESLMGEAPKKEEYKYEAPGKRTAARKAPSKKTSPRKSKDSNVDFDGSQVDVDSSEFFSESLPQDDNDHKLSPTTDTNADTGKRLCYGKAYKMTNPLCLACPDELPCSD